MNTWLEVKNIVMLQPQVARLERVEEGLIAYPVGPQGTCIALSVYRHCSGD